MEFNVNDMQRFFPSVWKHSDEYENKLYILVTLTQYDSDYNDIMGLFQAPYSIPKKIQRIQQPITYLRYLVQSEYMNKMNMSFTEQMAYAVINESEIDICLKYNCDHRYVKRNITFRDSPPDTQETLLIVKKRKCDLDTDKNHFPLYIVYF